MSASLSRLDTTYIDLLQIHRFDDETPVEETMEALHDLVKSGKVRYIGASSMWATQFAQMQFCAEKHGWTKFVSMQNYYNLLYREEEREMNRFCKSTGVGIIPVCASLCWFNIISVLTQCSGRPFSVVIFASLQKRMVRLHELLRRKPGEEQMSSWSRQSALCDGSRRLRRKEAGR